MLKQVFADIHQLGKAGIAGFGFRLDALENGDVYILSSLKANHHTRAGVPTKRATYQIVLLIIYLYYFKGKGMCGRVGLG